MNTILIRADASATHGTGHVMRCLALALALRERGARVVLAVAECPESLVERIQSSGVGVERLAVEVGSPEDAAATRALAGVSSAGWLVLDGYRFGLDFHRALGGGGFQLAVIDDFAHLDGYEADLLLNQNSQARAEDYPEVPRLLLGPSHALLRSEFVETLRGRAARSFGGPVRRLLVTMGGADPGNATTTILEALSALGSEPPETRVLVGAANPHRAAVDAAASGVRGCRVLDPVRDMVPLLEWADLAVCAGGSTLWEMAAFGVPVASVILAENQQPLVADLQQRGMVADLGWDRDLAPERCSRDLGALMADGARRQRMSEIGRGLVDGAGAERVARALLEPPGSLDPR
jgi:UDP-2,4-diacetamido-2,4,6-trideoxy-beta-L-altropyranose hydrolase